MAHFNTFVIASISLIVTGLALGTHYAFAHDDDDNNKIAPSPTNIAPAIAEDIKYLISIPPAEKKFIDDCSNKMKPQCGDELVSGLLVKGTVTDECCKQVVKMGRTCHRHLVTLLASYPDFRQSEAMIKESARKIWRGCEVVAAESPSS